MTASRSSFVQNEYRYEVASDPSIKATYPAARELLHETNLSAADAATVTTELFNATNTPSVAFKIEVVGTADGVDAHRFRPKAFKITDPRYNQDGSKTFKTTAMVIDWLNEKTIYEVRSA